MVHDNLLKELIAMIRFHAVNKLQGFFKTAQNECDDNGQPHLVLIATQRLLARIPSWTNAQVQGVYRSFANVTDNLDVLVTGCIDTRVAVFERCDRVSVRDPHEAIDVPAFIHRFFIESGRIFYMCPQILGIDSNPTIRQQNMRTCMDNIKEAVHRTMAFVRPMATMVKRLPKCPDPTTAQPRPRKYMPQARGNRKKRNTTGRSRIRTPAPHSGQQNEYEARDYSGAHGKSTTRPDIRRAALSVASATAKEGSAIVPLPPTDRVAPLPQRYESKKKAPADAGPVARERKVDVDDVEVASLPPQRYESKQKAPAVAGPVVRRGDGDADVVEVADPVARRRKVDVVEVAPPPQQYESVKKVPAVAGPVAMGDNVDADVVEVVSPPPQRYESKQKAPAVAGPVARGDNVEVGTLPPTDRVAPLLPRYESKKQVPVADPVALAKRRMIPDVGVVSILPTHDFKETDEVPPPTDRVVLPTYGSQKECTGDRATAAKNKMSQLERDVRKVNDSHAIYNKNPDAVPPLLPCVVDGVSLGLRPPSDETIKKASLQPRYEMQSPTRHNNRIHSPPPVEGAINDNSNNKLMCAGGEDRSFSQHSSNRTVVAQLKSTDMARGSRELTGCGDSHGDIIQYRKKKTTSVRRSPFARMTDGRYSSYYQ